jgi:uncharacterized protein (TIGR01777 family)
MFWVFSLISVQALLGGLDNLWHHEITERLPSRRSAAGELALHAAREAIYAFVFIALAWFQWQGHWALLLGGVLILEIIITLADFVVEDKTRRLPPFERILHTVLALTYGAAIAVLTPILAQWWRMPTEIVFVANGAFSWVFTVFAIGVFAWSVRNVIAVLTLRRPPEWVRDPIVAGTRQGARTVLISGATGFIGGNLVRRLVARGDRVMVLTRHPDVALDRFGPHVRIATNLSEVDAQEKIDAIVNLAGAPIMGFPWTRKRRQQLIASRLDTTRALVALMGRMTRPPRVFVTASAIGYYGIHGDEVIDEHGKPANIFQSRLCQEWEESAQAAEELGARVVRMRIGLVLGREGGALPQLALGVKLGFGAVLGEGRQWMSWIHIDDLVRMFEFALDTPSVRSALNAVSNKPVTHREFQHVLAATLRRPLWLRVPGVFLRVLLGEMAQLLVDGQRVVPSRATELGFRFRHPDVRSALSNLYGVRDALTAPAPISGEAEIYYNGECPVCRAEMSHYERLCATADPHLRFVDSMQHPDGLADCGLRREHLERRVYLRSQQGQLLSGLPALIALWMKMPQYRRLARVLSLPVVRQVATAAYDQVIAPGLAFWANRRIRMKSENA